LAQAIGSTISNVIFEEPKPQSLIHIALATRYHQRHERRRSPQLPVRRRREEQSISLNRKKLEVAVQKVLP